MGRIEEIRAHYEHRFSGSPENHEVLDWASAASQHRRFEVLIEHVPLQGKSLLDVGCGLGDLLGVLDQRGIAVAYTGVDVLGKMVDACRERYPGRPFAHGDIFAEDLFRPGEFDVVFTSGIFNLNLGNNLQFLPVAVRRMLWLAREQLVFNLLHVRAPAKEDRYFFYDPQEVLALLVDEPCEIRLVEDYLPNDFTIICRKGPEGRG